MLQEDLYSEIECQFEKLRDYEKGSHEYANLVDSTCKLLDRAIRINEIDYEHEEKLKQSDIDSEVKIQQRKKEFIERIVSIFGKTLEIAIPLAVYIWAFLVDLTFEETGMVSSWIGKATLNKLIPKK